MAVEVRFDPQTTKRLNAFQARIKADNDLQLGAAQARVEALQPSPLANALRHIVDEEIEARLAERHATKAVAA